jgi:hypothetical protein
LPQTRANSPFTLKEGRRSQFRRNQPTSPPQNRKSRDDDIASIRGLDYRFHHLGGRHHTGFLPAYEQGEEFLQLMSAGFAFRDVLGHADDGPGGTVYLSPKPPELDRQTPAAAVNVGHSGQTIEAPNLDPPIPKDF